VLWTAAILPSWEKTEAAGVIHKRFCMGWWNSPLVESIDKIDESEMATIPYSGTTNVRVLSWSALAFVLGTIAFAVRHFFKTTASATKRAEQSDARQSPVDRE
jgi:DNA primase catalytic subunit